MNSLGTEDDVNHSTLTVFEVKYHDQLDQSPCICLEIRCQQFHLCL